MLNYQARYDAILDQSERAHLYNHLSNYTKIIYYATIAPLYHIRAKERAKYATLLHCRTGQKYGPKRSDKMAAQNEPNFALFTSSDLEFLTDELFTEIKSNKRHFNGFACVVYVFRARIMQSIRCKMDFEN